MSKQIHLVEINTQLGDFRDAFLDENGHPSKQTEGQVSELLKHITKIKMSAEALLNDYGLNQAEIAVQNCAEIQRKLSIGNIRPLSVEMGINLDISGNLDSIQIVANEI